MLRSPGIWGQGTWPEGGRGSPHPTITLWAPWGRGRELTCVASAKLSVRSSRRTQGVTCQERPNSAWCCHQLSPARGPEPLRHSFVTHHVLAPHGHPSPPGHPSQPIPQGFGVGSRNGGSHAHPGSSWGAPGQSPEHPPAAAPRAPAPSGAWGGPPWQEVAGGWGAHVPASGPASWGPLPGLASALAQLPSTTS